jgi:hypothetical protein
MSNNMLSSHLTVEQLVDYFDKAMLEVEQEEVEIHLAECEACTQRARHAFTLCGEWEQWTARNHQEAVLRELMDHALQEAMAEAHMDAPHWQERLEQWRNVLIDLAHEVAFTVAELVFGPARAPVRVRGGVRESVPSPEIRVTLAGGPWTPHTRVATDIHAKEVVVRVERIPQTQLPPLVLLASTGHKTKITPLQRAPDGRSLIARFEEVGPGDYLIAIEPQETT